MISKRRWLVLAVLGLAALSVLLYSKIAFLHFSDDNGNHQLHSHISSDNDIKNSNPKQAPLCAFPCAFAVLLPSDFFKLSVSSAISFLFFEHGSSTIRSSLRRPKSEKQDVDKPELCCLHMRTTVKYKSAMNEICMTGSTIILWKCSPQ